MFAIKSDIVWLLLILHVSNCERRIQGGSVLTTKKPYVVYLVKAPISNAGYDYWLCGGALVTRDYVVTSAACLMDVDFLYVIAGYDKYVVDKDIDTDPCTSARKKKVIYTCYPDKYQLNYARTDQWAQIDIGVARVESPYNFSDESYMPMCSYTPRAIPISYDFKDREPRTDAIVMGWGHKLAWRQVTDNKNYNQGTLNYVSVEIMDKEKCKSEFKDVGNMAAVIDNYMICTQGKGQINEFGDLIEPDGKIGGFPNGCVKRKSMAYYPEENEEECEDEDVNKYDTRREMKEIKKNIINNNKTVVTNTTTLSHKSAVSNHRTTLNNRTEMDNITISSKSTINDFNTLRGSRRNGICQNDHGGPLVTWVGRREVLIGVASVFKVTENSSCTGPYLYTSTQCNGAFLDCILTKHTLEVEKEEGNANTTRRAVCRKSLRDKGYATVERHISWLRHPAGPADHEQHLRHGINEPDVNEQATRTDPENDNPPNNINLANNMNARDNKNVANNINPIKNMNSANNRYPPIEDYPITEKPSYVIDAINERFG